MKKLLLILTLFAFVPSMAQVSGKRKLRPSDVYRLKSISDAHVSPDDKWICYAVSSVDSAKDTRNTDLWMVSWDGLQNIQLTYGPDSESSPRWSPDGKYLSFTSSRQGKKTAYPLHSLSPMTGSGTSDASRFPADRSSRLPAVNDPTRV